MNDQSWNFYWKSPNILWWNPMLRYLVQCNNVNVYTPTVEQCHYRFKFTGWKYLTFNTPFLYLLEAVEWYWLFETWQLVMFSSVGICNFSLRNLILIFRWHQVMINHHLILKVFERIYSGRSFNRLCSLDFADEHATSAKMSLSKGHLSMRIHSKYYRGKLRITWYTWLS